MQIIYTLDKVTNRRIENLVFILTAGTSSLTLILFFCSFSNRLGDKQITVADLITCLLSISLIWTIVTIFIAMFERIKNDNKESFFTLISKIVAFLFIAAFCFLALGKWLPYIGCYILLGVVVVVYQTLRDWHLGQYIDYRIELYNKELLHGLPHFYLSDDIEKLLYLNEMKKNIADIFVSQKEMR